MPRPRSGRRALTRRLAPSHRSHGSRRRILTALGTSPSLGLRRDMNKLALSAALAVAPQLLGGCFALVRTDPVSLQKSDEMSKCARDADAAGESNPLRTE